MSSIVDTSLSNLPQPKSGWQLFKNLAFGEIAPGLAWEKIAYRRKFMLRSLATPLSTARLLSELAKLPHLMQMLQVQPGLPCRLHRPWLTVNMDRQRALASLSWHYQMMCRQLPATLAHGYLSKQGVTLLTLTGKDEQQFTVRLCADAFMDKEGEATLVFCDGQNTALAEMTFTLCLFEGKSTLFIGGLQGAKAHVPHELIQGATKACHGLFPKRLLVEAAMTLGAAFPVEQIVAVSNDTHIYRSWRYRKKKEGKLLADYDSFWLSLGGEKQDNGNFMLPLVMPRKPMEEIASKKRAEYRRRYALLDSLIQQVKQATQR
ncbi:VirK/YbjX family protein [Enterobacter asburiae]|uniref:VirK/YbjX family protein n=1 Tax=Enterobacter asburiae TaxID=61645 RepID=UPI002889DB87|nr:VirK/YbjX family protein [Enterobacter asburiae]WNI61450.1 VirK/YbjX family protein [Enterobacter asburiae]WNI66153.1 VirK/YbjX family protein [Enterobacter asburiae]